MNEYHFSIAFYGYINGKTVLQHTSYTVNDDSPVSSWRKALEYAVGVYGGLLYMVELRV